MGHVIAQHGLDRVSGILAPYVQVIKRGECARELECNDRFGELGEP